MASIQLRGHSSHELLEDVVDCVPAEVEQLVEVVSARVPGEDAEADKDLEL
jgi:hypothetical protein